MTDKLREVIAGALIDAVKDGDIEAAYPTASPHEIADVVLAALIEHKDALREWITPELWAQIAPWRPIEEAPKGDKWGGPLLLVNFKGKGVRAVSWDSPWSTDLPNNGIWCVDDDKMGPYALRGYVDGDEIGFLPLPALPAKDQDDGK